MVLQSFFAAKTIACIYQLSVYSKVIPKDQFFTSSIVYLHFVLQIYLGENCQSAMILLLTKAYFVPRFAFWHVFGQIDAKGDSFLTYSV